jgi:ABC-type transport system involved in multi-copper enzyme maturation permease subunit
MRLILSLAEFELRQHLRSHVFWIVVTISALMVAGALWIPELRVGVGGDRSVSGAALVVRTHLLWSLFYMFTAAAFAGDAVLRDQLSGFEPIIRATPAPRRLYLIGRFAGAYAATAICFLSVPAALLLATVDRLVAWSDLPRAAFVTGLLVLALPNLFISAAIFFVLATALRSMLGTLVGAVALLSLYGLGVQTGGGSGWALLEPFGFAASAEGDPNLLLRNRLLWLLLSGGGLALLASVPPRRSRQQAAATPTSGEPAGRSSPLHLASPSFGIVTSLTQFAHRTRLELRQILGSPSFAILLIMGLGNAAATIWRLHAGVAPPDPPSTVRALIDAFDLVPVVVAVFFAGELFWSERDHRVFELVGASPAPTSVLLLPKLVALGFALLGLALASGGAAIAVPRLTGGSGPSLPQLFGWYIVPKSLDWLLLGILAVFLQAVSPNKLAGWGWAVLFLILSLGLDQASFRDPIYHYGRYPGYPLPAALSDADQASMHLAYWGALALLLLVLSDAMSSRGLPDPLLKRMVVAARRLRGARGLAAAATGLIWAGLGAVLVAR